MWPWTISERQAILGRVCLHVWPAATSDRWMVQAKHLRPLSELTALFHALHRRNASSQVKAGNADKYGGNHTCQSFVAAGKRPFANIQAWKWLLWCSLVHSADEDVQVTIEQQALEDYLLSDPPLKAAASQLLSVRAASPDIVTQVLTQLSSRPPQELWSLIHADAAAGGKPAKAAPAKAPAAVKGKAGEL